MDRKLHTVALLMLAVASGCAAGRNRGVSQNQRGALDATGLATVEKTAPLSGPEHELVKETEETPATRTRLAAYQVEVPPTHDDPETILPPLMAAAEDVAVAAAPALLLGDLEGMAMANNPTLVQATAQIQAARGGAYQAGLYPNPVVGYTGEQIGVSGTAGETQGGFIAQEFVTGGKLRLSRAKWTQRARIAETNLLIQQRRVLNDVQAQFYRTLAAQRLVEIHRELVANGEDNLQTYREMLNLGQANQSQLLQAEVGLQRDRLDLKQAENEFQHAWRNLVSLAGVPELAPGTLAGTLEPGDESLDWDAALSQLLSESPELRAAWQKIRHDEITVERERVQPIPNLLTDVTVGRNFEAGDTTATVNLGIPLPIFDRNQGTIQQARSDLMQSHAEVRRLELELRTRLAGQYRDYQTAWQRVRTYQNEMLPKAEESYDLLHDSYKARRAAWPDVLTAQRLYLNLRREHLGNLTTYREGDVAIRGMLLTGGLAQPQSPVSGGHIDAVPKPR